MEQLSVKQILQFVGGETKNKETVENIMVTNICTDTRKIGPGSLFVPIKGENFDGHTFIEDAFKKGAVAALSHEKISGSGVVISVEDTRVALRDLAEHYLAMFKIPVVAVTGSVGKTSCKDMLAAVLGSRFEVLKTDGNFNNDIGVPLTVFRIEKEHELAILEMGMNHFDEITVLSKIARPDYAVITNIGVSHIENLGSREGIFKAKKEVFDYMTSQGMAIINGDDDYLPQLESELEMKTKVFGLTKDFAYKADEIKSLGYKGMSALFSTPHKSFKVDVPALGEHMIYNVLPAIAIAEDLGLSEEEIKKGIQSFVPTKMRLNIYEVGNNITIIDDVYNASPDSMKAALKTLDQLPCEGKKIAILGDMFEMGDHAQDGHRKVGADAAKMNIDLLICVGGDAHYIKEAYGHKSAYYFPTIQEANKAIEQIIEPEDTILLKASRGMHFEKMIEFIKEVAQ